MMARRPRKERDGQEAGEKPPAQQEIRPRRARPDLAAEAVSEREREQHSRERREKDERLAGRDARSAARDERAGEQPLPDRREETPRHLRVEERRVLRGVERRFRPRGVGPDPAGQREVHEDEDEGGREREQQQPAPAKGAAPRPGEHEDAERESAEHRLGAREAQQEEQDGSEAQASGFHLPDERLGGEQEEEDRQPDLHPAQDSPETWPRREHEERRAQGHGRPARPVRRGGARGGLIPPETRRRGRTRRARARLLAAPLAPAGRGARDRGGSSPRCSGARRDHRRTGGRRQPETRTGGRCRSRPAGRMKLPTASRSEARTAPASAAATTTIRTRAYRAENPF